MVISASGHRARYRMTQLRSLSPLMPQHAHSAGPVLPPALTQGFSFFSHASLSLAQWLIHATKPLQQKRLRKQRRLASVMWRVLAPFARRRFILLLRQIILPKTRAILPPERWQPGHRGGKVSVFSFMKQSLQPGFLLSLGSAPRTGSSQMGKCLYGVSTKSFLLIKPLPTAFPSCSWGKGIFSKEQFSTPSCTLQTDFPENGLCPPAHTTSFWT